MPNLVESIKKAAIEAVEQSNPVTIVFGRVLSVLPLIINVEQKLTLTDAQLIRAYNARFNIDDEVILLRMQGGQRYIIIDKVANV